MAVNKVVYGSNILIDLSSDTASAAAVASGYTTHIANGTQVTGTMSTIGKNGLKWSELTSKPWGIVSYGAPAYFTKSITFSAATSSQLIWSASELPGLSFTNLSIYDFVSITGTLTSATQQTNQLTFCNCFSPGYPYSSSESRYGFMSYHGSSTSACSMYAKTTSITTSSSGYFYVNSNGVYFAATPTYGLKGTYTFVLMAKLA